MKSLPEPRSTLIHQSALWSALGAAAAVIGCATSADDPAPTDPTLGGEMTTGITNPATGGTGNTLPTTAGTTSDMPVATAGTGGAGTSMGGNTSTAGSGGSGGTAMPPVVLPPPANIPFTVSDRYVPGGFMGYEDLVEGTTETDGIVMTADDCAERVEGAVGVCYSITYQPQTIPADAPTWAGVLWQSPDQNWGTQPGIPVAEGATKVSFVAWGEAGGESVAFQAGGIISGFTYNDTFKIQKVVELTAEPTTYELDLSTTTYDQVLSAFGWVIETESMDPVTFYVDSIQWE